MSTLSGPDPDSTYRRVDAARRIADLIRSDLHAGRLDEQLPYDWELIRRYRGSRTATREALGLLSDQGVIRRLPGIGTMRRVDRTALRLPHPARVVEVVPASDPTRSIDPGDDVDGVRTETIARERLQAPTAVAEALDIDEGDEVLFSESVIEIDGSPHRIRSSWIPIVRVPGLEAVAVPLSPPQLLKELLGTDLSFTRFLVEAETADPAVAALLQIRPGAALIINERVLATEEGVPVEFGFTRHRGDRSYFHLADERV